MNYIYAIDGDDIGRRIELALFNNDIESARMVSMAVESTLDIINKYFIERGAETIFIAGDSVLLKSSFYIDVSLSVFDFKEFTFSMGVANSASDAVLALKKAKGLGKNRSVNMSIEKNEG